VLVLLSPLALWAAWNDGNPTGPYSHAINNFPGPAYGGHDIPNAGGSENIRQWSTCKQVINNCANRIYIPTRTQAEWRAFVSNPPGCTTVNTITCY
jgi:hypothetical protein